MIYLELFATFFEIGLFTFGGGYAMISLISEKISAYGWISNEQLLNMIAVSESTPGPIAVNMATYVGASRGGILGAFVATVGVVLPSFIIILIIVATIKNFLRYKGVNAFLEGVRPCVVALILATALTLLLSVIFDFKSIGDKVIPDVKGIIILCVLVAIGFVLKRILKKKPSPIFMIVISACIGMLIYSI